MRLLSGLVLVLLSLATALPAAGAEAEGAPSRRRTVPDTIDAMGGADVTTALNDFFAGVPAGSVVVFPSWGRYRIEGTVSILRQRDLTIEGNRSTLFATTEGDSKRTHLRIEKSAGVSIRDLRIRGAHPDGGDNEAAWREDKAWQHGIDIIGSTDVELDALEITDAFGDLVQVGWDDEGTWSERVWIHDSFLARNGRQGIAVTAARDVVIEDNVITDTRRATVDLEPDLPKYGAENIHVIDNRIGPGWLRFIAAHGNGPVNDVVIARNELRGRDLAVDVKAPEGTRRSNFHIVDNSSDEAVGATPVRLIGIDGVVVRGNEQPFQRAGVPAVLTWGVCGLTVEANGFGPPANGVERNGGECGRPIAADVPPPPAIPAREAALRFEESLREAIAGPTTTAPGGTATTAPGEPATTVPGEEVPAGDGDDSGPTGWLVAAAAAVAALAVLTGVLLRRRRASRAGDAEPAGEERRVPELTSGSGGHDG